jgi:hypothetical protein
MTYGFRITNANNIVNVDEDSFSYVYLGKVAFDVNNTLEQAVTFTCVGYPLVFFGVPYGTVNGGENNASLGHSTLIMRAGVQMTRLQQVNSNTWTANIRCNFVNGGNPGQLYLRVFGKLHQNFPNGAGQSYGARAWNAAGQLIFDTGCRQLRLAGNTYDTELALSSTVPLDDQRVDSCDTSVTLPFNLSNKSIMANTRGSIIYPYYTGTDKDPDTQQDVNHFDFETVTTLFWANGNTLYARKASSNTQRVDRTNDIIVSGNGSVTYTRVAVIDNNLFP